MPLIGIKLSGQKLTSQKIGVIRDYLSDLEPIANYMRDRFSREVIANFKRGGPPDAPWQPLADSTQRSRDEKVGYYAQPGKGGILHWTGSLKDSFKVGGKNAYLRVTNRSRGFFEMQFGTNHPLGALHHFGASFTRPALVPTSGKALRMVMGDGIRFAKSAGPANITIPARPFWSDQQVERIVAEGQKRARKKIRELING